MPPNTSNETDIEFVVRTMKQIEYWLNKGTTKIDIENLSEDDQIPDLYRLIELYNDHFESRQAYHRLHDMRHIRNRLVHQVGYDRIRKFNNINRIGSRRDYEEAFALLERDISRAIESKKRAEESAASRKKQKPSGCFSVVAALGLLIVPAVGIVLMWSR